MNTSCGVPALFPRMRCDVCGKWCAPENCPSGVLWTCAPSKCMSHNVCTFLFEVQRLRPMFPDLDIPPRLRRNHMVR